MEWVEVEQIGRNATSIATTVQMCGDFETQFDLIRRLVLWLNYFAKEDEKVNFFEETFKSLGRELPRDAKKILFKLPSKYDEHYKARVFLLAYNMFAKKRLRNRTLYPVVITLECLELYVGSRRIYHPFHRNLNCLYVSFSERSKRIHAFISFRDIDDPEWLTEDRVPFTIQQNLVDSVCFYLPEAVDGCILHIKLALEFGTFFPSVSLPDFLKNETSVFLRFRDESRTKEGMHLIGVAEHAYNEKTCTIGSDYEVQEDFVDHSSEEPQGLNHTPEEGNAAEASQSPVTNPGADTLDSVKDPMECLKRRIIALGLDIYDPAIYTEDTMDLLPEFTNL